MSHAQTQPGFDPRKTITPESFHVAPHLLGLPLASPSRRLAAILVDLLLVSIVANLGGKILFAVALAAAFFWFAGRRLGNQGGFFSRSVRLGFRGFGALMLFVAAMAIWKRAGREVEHVVEAADEAPVVTAGVNGGGKGTRATVGNAVRMVAAVSALNGAEDSAGAARASRNAINQLRRMGVADAEIRGTIADAVKDRPAPVKAGALAALPPAETFPAAADADDDEDGAAAKADTVPANPDSLAAAYVNAVRGGDSARADLLRPKLASTLAGDSLRELHGRVGELENDKSEMQRENEKLQHQGLLGTLLEWLDDLGIGFGWTALYFTFFTAMMRGQTPGKKLFGVRVLRLDGGPMTLWASFERYGGYAAGLFTGLTGYMQIYWDRNRQAIQDKISETVVIRDYGQPLPVARPATMPYPPHGPVGPYGPHGPYGPPAQQPPYPPPAEVAAP
jgi:hypothetical protein